MIRILKHSVNLIFCLCTALLVSGGVTAQDLSGRWQGTLAAAQYAPIEVVFNLHKTNSETNSETSSSASHTGTLDIPGQFRTGLPIDSVSIRDQQIIIRLSSIQVEYYGSLVMAENGDVIAIEGDWNQSGEYVPLRLEASTEPGAADKAAGL